MPLMTTERSPGCHANASFIGGNKKKRGRKKITLPLMTTERSPGCHANAPESLAFATVSITEPACSAAPICISISISISTSISTLTLISVSISISMSIYLSLYICIYV